MIQRIFFLCLTTTVVWARFRNPDMDDLITFAELEDTSERSGVSIENLVLESLDPSINRCDDFYQYACGGHLAHKKKGFIYAASVSLYQTVLSIVRQNPILLGFYQSCLNQVNSETRISVKIKNTLEAMDRATNVSQIMRLLGSAAKVTPVNPFLHNMQLFPVLREDNNKGLLYFDIGLLDDDETEDIALKILQTENLLNAEDIQSVQSDLQNIPTVKPKKTHDFDADDIEPRSDSELQYTIDIFVKAFPSAVGPMFQQYFGDRKLSELIVDSRVNIFSLARIEAFLAKADVSAVRKVVKLAMAKAVAALYPVFRSEDPGAAAMVCLKKTMSSLSDEVGRDYMNVVLTKNVESTTRKMINNIIKEAQDLLSFENSTLDKPTRDDFGEKINNVKVHIGGQKNGGNYKKIDFAGNNVLTNLIEISRISNKKLISAIGVKVDPYEIIEAAQVNAFYHPLYNDMFIPAGILQSPMFGKEYPVAIQHSVIGYVLAHELTHSIDPNCLKVNRYGEERTKWYTSPKAKAVLEKHAQCYIDEYSKFKVIGKKGQLIGYVNGKKTVGENVADSGMQLAYSAYLKTGDKETFGNFTSEQLFFVTSAQVWCNDISDELAENLLKNDVHTFTKARVNGALMNNAQFGKVFNCPVGSPMNPERKCNWWGKP